MHKPEDEFMEMEKALARLLPVSIGEGAQARMEDMIDGLAGESETQKISLFPTWKWLATAGIAAVLSLGAFLTFSSDPANKTTTALIETPEMVFLSESDRVEKVSDEGLYVDSGGSAVRKVRVRVIEESRIRDEETGIVVMLTEPREEMYMVPVSTF